MGEYRRNMVLFLVSPDGFRELAEPERPTMGFRKGALGHMLSRSLENEFNHMGDQSIHHVYIMKPPKKLR